MRIIAYTRVSTSEQAESGLGLDAQRTAILSEAKRRDWAETDIEWITDAGFSAKTLKRPGLAIALDALKNGEASVLIVAKTDRLSRSLIDFASIMQQAQKQSWTLLALDSVADMTTPAGEAMVHVMAVFAQLERRLIAQRTTDAMAEAKKRGVVLGAPRRLDAVAERIKSERAAGKTMQAIADGLTADGVPTARKGVWRPGTIARVLETYV